MHLNLLVVDLSVLSGHLDVQRSQIIITVIRLAFIYLVMTSLFRVFDQFFQLDMSRIPSAGSTRQNAKDDEWVEKITEALEEAKAYREMGLNRERFAAQLDLQEHQLSRIINVYFKRSFTELLNHYRVQEAMERLKQETTPITVIAFEVGFNSIASFNRVFKDVVGCSPTEYRNRSH